ncbi:MAG: metallophosphatase family protein [Alphaproteobacteria bacterium]|nr:metallophosphatase family protein [Alphaproteobacteria bacterium]
MILVFLTGTIPLTATAKADLLAGRSYQKPKPAFMIFGGDMCYRGYMDGKYIFQIFKDLFKQLADSGIILYMAIGNHELYHHNSSYGFLLVNQQQFLSVFSENPSNGPAGHDHLVCFFTDPASSSIFAVLDPYFLTTDTIHPNGLGGL